ncbi:hypothetical protein Ddye_027937 [Dipteronia dyeriana]|uniref:Peptidase A1 domain-containing protein n=1 Tax=Dipteronia dyeriana TaxID=168575 RepID=A0AAD9WRW7_9ROSI|nr:hypothetical protein Ddye_027937 [Dipteronia dyeriana]
MASLIMQNFSVAALFLCLVIFSKFHFSASKSVGFRLKLIPRDSPESPLYPGNLTKLERFQRSVYFSHARANYMTSVSTTNRNATLKPDNIVVHMAYDDGYYIGEVGIGTPPVPVLLVVDTGGGQIWTQCEPCENCFPQDSPRYDSRASSTYQRLPCEHPFCSGDHPLYQCVDNVCVYGTTYYAGSVTKGFASVESFFFNDIDGGSDIVASPVIFGCSHISLNFKFAEGRQISGIMGLNLSPDSLLSQLGDGIDNRFSYCMPPSSEATAPLILRFGNDIPYDTGMIQTTSFFTVPGMHYYMLSLLDISINSIRLHFPPGTFDRSVEHSTTAGFVIDSGAPLTLIDEHTNHVNAYKVLTDALKLYYVSYGLQEKVFAGSDEICYDEKPDFYEHPTITYHFVGADYTVDSRFVSTRFVGHQPNYFCINIIKGSGVSILGANDQQNRRIIYDNNMNSIQFFPEECAHDHPA